MTSHRNRPAFPSKPAVIREARGMQTITKHLYRIWACRYCSGAWHVAEWHELIGGTP